MTAPVDFFSGALAAQNGVRHWCPDGYIYPSGANAPLRLSQWRGAASRGTYPSSGPMPIKPQQSKGRHYGRTSD